LRPPPPSTQDEILLLLRQSDAEFTGNTIVLPQIAMVTEGEPVPTWACAGARPCAEQQLQLAATAAQADQAEYAAKAAAGSSGRPWMCARKRQ
jgi:adhesin transport system outer membrane protein